MEDEFFFKLFIPALEQALKNDDDNDCYHVKLPLDYIDNANFEKVDVFMEENYVKHKLLFDLINQYFDAKAHHFSDLNGVPLETIKKLILTSISIVKKTYNIG